MVLDFLKKKRQGISKTVEEFKHIKASTFQKGGGKVPTGPREKLFCREIEDELEIYR